MVYIIAEIGQAHDGSLGILHSYIDAIAATGVDAIKFQTHIAEAESSCHEPFRIPFSYEDPTRYAYWKRMEFTPDQWQGIKQHCDDCNVDFISSPFSNAAVDLLEQIHTPIYKIGSGETSNFLLLQKIAQTGKPMILSTGLSSFGELDAALQFLRPFKTALTLMQCTTKYPTQPEDIGLNVLGELKERYGLPVGLSDHSGTIFPCLGAVTLGAAMVEFHAVFDKKMFGPDSTASLTPKEIRQLVKGIRFTEKMRTTPVDKEDTRSLSDLKTIFEKSLAVNKSLASGHILTFDDLEAKKPKGLGIDARKFSRVIGKPLSKPLNQWDFLKEDDLKTECP